MSEFLSVTDLRALATPNMLTVQLQGRSEWSAARSTGIGASEAAAILGVSPWKSSLQLYHEKKGAEPAPQGETFARRLGLELENPIAALYADDTKRYVYRPPEGRFWLTRHAKKAHMLATVDGFQAAGAEDSNEPMRQRLSVVEIKSAAISKVALWRDDPPIDYIVQVQHQLACTGLEYATCVGLLGGVYLKYKDIRRDDEFIAMLEQAIDDWWRGFEAGIPPAPDGSESTREFLKRLYPHANPKTVALGPEAIEWDRQLQEAKAEIKKQERIQILAENQLKNAIADNVQGVLPNGIVYTLKEQKREGYSVKSTSFRMLRRRATAEERRQQGKGPKPPKLDVGATAASEQDTETAFNDEDLF